MKKAALVLFAAVLCISAQAQKKSDGWTLGLNVGTFEYKGDLGSEFWSFKDVNIAGGVALNKYINPSFDFLGTLTFGKLDYDDGTNNFETKLIDLNLMAKYKFNNGKIMKEEAKWAPFLVAGLGDAIARGTHFTNGTDVNFNFPLGGGLMFRLGERSSLNIASIYHYSTSDEYDNNAPVVANGGRNDAYFYHSVGILFGLSGAKDTDGDGVKDKDDRCPDQKGVASLKGCPDSDKDGFADKVDRCPRTPGSYKGCPDKDKDQVADNEDKCPDVAGPKEMGGCPDSDGDGIPDGDDTCPNEKGTQAMKGCPDSDGDGFADKFDSCPDHPGTSNGCPDTDGDGLSDDIDQCPKQPGPAENEGCPAGTPTGSGTGTGTTPVATSPANTSVDVMDEVLANYPLTEEDMKEISKIANNLFFSTGSYELNKRSRNKLDKMADILKRNAGMKLGIEGHTDSMGAEKENQALSEKRAIAVQGYLVGKGVEAGRLSISGKGEKEPMEPNTTSGNMRDNRRVTLKTYY